jgi:tRNA pseudouridine32 synthase / 23S rRNA pseudouridine746 synthase
MTIEVIYQDDALIVLNKPSGLLSVPGRGADKQDCLSSRVQAVFPDALVVHRLDMATSGLLVLARSLAHQRTLSNAFAAREVHKRYVAIVTGQLDSPPDDWHTIDLPIIVDWPNRPLRIIDPLHGKPSMTRYRCLQTDAGDNTSRVELEPVTGRSHQLRVHLQALGHPILGDTLYAPEPVALQAPRLLLHAAHIRLNHPSLGTPMKFDCPAGF